MIEQVCSMALTYAHHSGRERFSWEDIFEAMATVESGTAINIEYVPEETRAVAIHEAGHAAAARLHEGARVDACVDSPARLARPPSRPSRRRSVSHASARSRWPR